MSDQNQLNKKEQPLENRENLEPVQQESADLAPEVSADLAPEVSADLAPEVSADLAPEVSADLAPEVSADLAPEVSPLPAPEVSPLPAPEVSPLPAPEVSPLPAPEVSPLPESRGHQLKADQKDLREDLEPAQQERPESRGHDSRADLKEQKEDLMVDVVPARKEDPEPTQAEIQKPEPTVVNLGRLGAAAVVVLIAVWLGLYLPQFRGTQTSDSRSALQIFQDQFKSLQKDFPKQSRALWLRSEKMLRNHLNKSEPHEPAMIILTAAQDAKHTLLCLGSGLAQTYAAAHNAKWLVIHGPSESEYDDSTAKLHIDEKLSSGFQTESRAAVLNRLETLPPGSLLILYKYCDHENAAYKNVALVFTVLLEESSLEPDISLPELEEKVRDFLWQQFISSSTIRSHMEMDSDKLGGVWSRISHLVLPVVPVESIETGNCPFKHEGK